MNRGGCRSLVATSIALIALAGSAGPALAAGAERPSCAATIADLRRQVAKVAPGSPQAVSVLSNALAGAFQRHPECQTEIAAFGASLRPPVAHQGRAFLGPFGWLWNSIRFRVFHGDGVMMALFGWELFLAPFILAVAARGILTGATGGLRRPAPPSSV